MTKHLTKHLITEHTSIEPLTQPHHLHQAVLGSVLFGLALLSGCTSTNTRHTPAPIVDHSTKPSLHKPVVQHQQPQQQPPSVLPSAPQGIAQDITQTPKLDSETLPLDTATTAPVQPTTPTAVLEPQTPSAEPSPPLLPSIKNDQLSMIKRVVVLLPDRPNLQQVNRDIVQGVRQAHKLMPHHQSLELLVVHDDLPIDQLILKVNGLAPDAVIGPLTKADIQETSQLTAGIQVALNRHQTPDHRVQMGLAPEDELKQLLSKAKYPNLPIAVLSGQEAQDKRLLTALEGLLASTETPIIRVPYSGNGADFTDWIKQEARLEQSQKRIALLKQTIKQPLQSEPRLRKDIQGFISLTSAKNTRAPISTLRYYQASWPLLATSKLIPPRKATDLHEPDLEGLQVVVPPYLLNDVPVNNAFEALGFDAYHLLAYHDVNQLAGQTGKLTSQQKQIIRYLEWRAFRKGSLANWQIPPTIPATATTPSTTGTATGTATGTPN